MTSVSFSFSHEELIDSECKSLIESAKNLKTVQYTIPPIPKFTNANALQIIKDIKSLGPRDVVISIGISIKSFQNQSHNEMINYIKEILLDTGVYRINLDFTEFSASGGITDSANQLPLQVFKKIIAMVKTIQRDFEYSIFVSVSFSVSAYLLLLEQDLRILDCFLTELINISMIQFIIRKSFKKTSETWGELIANCHNRLNSQFDGRYANYFAVAQKPSFAYRLYYPTNLYMKGTFSQEDLLDCIQSCQRNNIPLLVIGLSTKNAKRFRNTMPDKFLQENLGSMNKELEVPLHLSLLSNEDRLQSLEDREFRSASASDSKAQSQATLPSYHDVTRGPSGSGESSASTTAPAPAPAPEEDTSDVETISFPPSYSSVVVPTLKSLKKELPKDLADDDSIPPN